MDLGTVSHFSLLADLPVFNRCAISSGNTSNDGNLILYVRGLKACE